MKDLIIFGNSKFAELIKYYFEIDSEYNIVAFCIDDEYKKSDVFCGLPLVAYSQIDNYSPERYEIFVAIGYNQLNDIRTEVYNRLKKKGYSFASYISSKAIILSDDIGENCMICENTTIEPFARVGNNVFIWNGNCIAHQADIKDNVFITSQVMICGFVTIGENTFIGAKATITDHATVGKRCIIGAGSLIKSDLPHLSVCAEKETRKSEITSTQFLESGFNL